MKFVLFIISIMVGVHLVGQEHPTNPYGLYLTQTPQGYVLSDSARLIANDSIRPNTRYAHLIRQNDCFVPFSKSKVQSVSLPEPYKTCTKEFLLKKIATRNLKIKVDIPVGITKPCPFVVFIHGGGWYIGDEEGFLEQSRYFASNGIAGVRVSYTLVPEGGNIHTALSELQDALKFIFSHADEWGLDVSRFGFCGDSAGGYLSSYMAMTTPGTKLYIGICGMYNLLKIDDGYFPGTQGRTTFFKTESVDSLKKYSPIYRIPNNPPATLLMHGTADPTINCRQSKEFADSIHKKGGYAELALYEGYGHLFSLKDFSDCSKKVLLKKLAFAQQIFSISLGNRSTLFRAGDRISFIGNSITQNGFHLRYLMLYYATRFPNMPLIFNSAGISGDTTEDISSRMGVDILPQCPDVAVMMSGMNDAFRYFPISVNDPLKNEKREKSVEKYESEYIRSINSLLTDGRRMVLFTPSIYDEHTTLDSYNDKSINATLSAYRDKVKGWGEQYHIPVVDMWKGLMEVNTALQANDPKSSIIGYDRVHPGHFGGFVMAYLFLKDFKEFTVVSDVVIDTKKRCTDVKNGCISAVQYNKSTLSFTLLEQSLPFPLDAAIKEAGNYIPFQKEMNLQLLKVTNLKKGQYQLFIDEQPVGKYESNELKKGINLADNINTPQYKQAEKVSELCEQLRSAFSDYRSIKLIECQRMGIKFNFEDVDACIQKVNLLIKEDTTASDWIKSTYKWYIENKPKECDKLKHIANLRKLIYQQAKPEVHQYRLSFLNQKKGSDTPYAQCLLNTSHEANLHSNNTP